MPKDSTTKSLEVLERTEAQLIQETQQGAHPLQILVAGALPILRQVISEAGNTPGAVEVLVDAFIAGIATLRPDDAGPIVIAGAAARYGAPVSCTQRHRGSDDEGAFACFTLGEPLGVKDFADWLF